MDLFPSDIKVVIILFLFIMHKISRWLVVTTSTYVRFLPRKSCLSHGSRHAKNKTPIIIMTSYIITSNISYHHRFLTVSIRILVKNLIVVMKFKAKLTPQQTNLLYNLIHPISRLHPSSTSSSSSLAFSSPSTILYLDNDKLVLSTRGGSASTSSNSNPSSSFNHASSSFTYTQSNNAHTNDAEGIFCFAELITKDGIFKELIIQSLENDNAILMDIHIGQLRTALRGVLNAQLKYMKENSGGKVDIASANNINGVSGPELTIKLAKRNGGMPHLCLDVKDYHNNNSSSNNNRQIPQAPGSSMSRMIGVHHAIPVRMMRVEELQYHVPPRLGMPDVQLELPRDRPLKNVVDRLRSISPHGKETISILATISY